MCLAKLTAPSEIYFVGSQPIFRGVVPMLVYFYSLRCRTQCMPLRARCTLLTHKVLMMVEIILDNWQLLFFSLTFHTKVVHFQTQ